MDYLDNLNPQQREAVLAPPGANLVLAGAGSGKTRVLVCRVLHLIAQGVAPGRILAITFTNKAAGEMRERLFAAPGGGARGVWTGTFHAVCARILRAEAEAAGLPPGFTIFSRSECLSLVKRCMAERGVSPERYPPKSLLEWMGRRKTSGEADDADQPPFSTGAVAQGLAPRYERALRAAGAVDFDDLLVQPLRMFRKRPDILKTYQDRFLEILVDEYQDTNPVQDALVALLSRGHGSVFAVGDDDQGIYSWRGARVENILHFERRFPGARVFRLEENYRSSGGILRAAAQVMEGARRRRPKRLFTRNEAGEAVCYLAAKDAEAEAESLIGRLVREGAGGRIPWKDTAVFYRVNTQARPLEEAARRRGIPYRVVKGQRFFDRAEVQDLAAYLRAIHMPEDGVAFSRIVNRPPRGLGPERLKAIAPEGSAHLTPTDARAALSAGRLRGAAAKRLGALLETRDALAARGLGPARLLEEVLERMGYRAWLEGAVRGSASPERRREAARGLEGAREFVDAAAAFEARLRAEGRAAPDSAEANALFLEELALMGEADEPAGESGALSLLTLHAAKGLEFAAVGIVGVQEGLIPHARARDDPASLEEERRLLYVGMTRAKEALCLSWAQERRPEGRSKGWESLPSRFLEELGADLLRRVGDRPQAAGGPPRGSSAAPAARPPGMRDAPAAPPTAALGPYAPGTRVRHKKFGLGVVFAHSGVGEREMVSVEFEKAGKKKLVVKYTPMAPVDAGGRRKV